MVFVYKKVKKNMLSEKESMFWMLGTIIILILGIIPEILDMLAKKLCIVYPPSLLFLLGNIFCLALVFRLTVMVSILKEQTKELAEINAILNRRVCDLEKENK